VLFDNLFLSISSSACARTALKLRFDSDLVAALFPSRNLLGLQLEKQQRCWIGV
jgi:hypothetical protein